MSIYIDSGTDNSDPGNILVTVKRPLTPATTTYTSGGTASGYATGATGLAQYVGDVPNTSAADITSSTANAQQTFTIESQSGGFENISGDTLIADEAYMIAKSSGTCTADTILNGASTANLTLTTSTDEFYTVANNSTYPSANTAIGTQNCSSGTITVYGEGIMIAYTTSGGGTALSNFPVLVKLTGDADLIAHAQSSGADILFTDSTGKTLLPFELESYSSGNLAAWVDISSLSTLSDTIIYMYFGNPSTTSKANAPNTWNSNYAAVWHLGATSGTNVADSTTNAFNATSANTITGATGQIGGAQRFNGTSDFDKKSNVAGLDTLSSVTVSAWVNTGTAAEQIFNAGNGSSNGYELYISGSDVCLWAGSSLCSTTKASTNGGEFLAGTIGSGTAAIFASGSAVTTGSLSITSATIDNQIGTKCTASGSTTCSSFYSGLIDEVEVQNTAVSSGFILTEYNNQATPLSFYTLGNVETDIYAPTMSQLMRHGQWFSSEGQVQPFTF